MDMNHNLLFVVDNQRRSRNLSIDGYCQTVRFTIYELGVSAFGAVQC